MRIRSVRGGVSGSARRVHRSQQASVDWRANMFFVYVGNLSNRVSKGAIWEAFSEYGRVMDVYIPSSFRGNWGKDTIFGFVRYKFRSEMVNAIIVGNNRKIDGRFIRANEASYRWSERRVSKLNQSQGSSRYTVMNKRYGRRSWELRDYRSYADMVRGKGDYEMEQIKVEEDAVHGNLRQSITKQDIKEGLDEVSFETKIPSDDMEWLHRSVIGV
ncbi:hypothetical protein DITRI_Ditri09bG0108400 [Diplodiscus trichospermus]